MNAQKLVFRTAVPVLILAAALLPGRGVASTWCGDNGLIRFSFVQGDSLVTVLNTEEAEGGVTSFDLYAWLTDLDSVARDGEAFLHLGGMELKLDITGGEAFILEEEFPSQVLNVGGGMGHVAAGLHPGEKIRDGRVFLVRWKIMFQGRPENVRFGLDPSGLKSCAELEGCADCEPVALYVGNESSQQVGVIFGAGYVPSWVNPTGEPDQTPVTGKCSWSDVGVFTAR